MLPIHRESAERHRPLVVRVVDLDPSLAAAFEQHAESVRADRLALVEEVQPRLLRFCV